MDKVNCSFCQDGKLIEELTEQRDDLLHACKYLASVVGSANYGREAMKVASAAIAKASATAAVSS